jgi:hypothetical protein
LEALKGLIGEKMFRRKMIGFILLTVVLVSDKAYCQQKTSSRQIFTFVGQVTKFDLDSDVINVISGAVEKQEFSNAHLNVDPLWNALIKIGYIDSNGTIQDKYYALDKFSSMILPKEFNAKKKLIYTIFQNALADNGQRKVFYFTFNSELLLGNRNMAIVEIEQGDPVTIQYVNSSPDKNNIIRLVDNKSDDD